MEVGVGILGAGTVGSEVLRTLLDDREAISTKTGLDLSVKRVAVRQTQGDRPYRPPA